MTASHRRAVDWRIQEYAWGRKAILLDLVKDLRCINTKYLSKPKSFVVSDKKQEAKSGSTNSSYWLIVDDEKKYQLPTDKRANSSTSFFTRYEWRETMEFWCRSDAFFLRCSTQRRTIDFLHPSLTYGIRNNSLDINTGLSSLQLSANFHSLRDKMKGLHSGLIQEPMDSSLRFTNYIACLLYRMKQGYPVKDPVDAFLQEAKRISS